MITNCSKIDESFTDFLYEPLQNKKKNKIDNKL